MADYDSAKDASARFAAVPPATEKRIDDLIAYHNIGDPPTSPENAELLKMKLMEEAAADPQFEKKLEIMEQNHVAFVVDSNQHPTKNGWDGITGDGPTLHLDPRTVHQEGFSLSDAGAGLATGPAAAPRVAPSGDFAKPPPLLNNMG